MTMPFCFIILIPAILFLLAISHLAATQKKKKKDKCKVYSTPLARNILMEIDGKIHNL